MLQRAREAYAQIEGQATPVYGTVAAFAVAAPLVVGTLTGHPAAGSAIALGAYLVALRAPEGPYGARARNLAGTVLIVTLGATIGGYLAGHTVVAVLVVPPIVALGTSVPWIGPTAALAVLMTAVRPVSGHVVHNGLLEFAGALWVSALILAPWPARRLRPLRAALGEAAEEIAGALDAVAQGIGHPDTSALDAVEVADPALAEVAHVPDWAERRRAASRALGAARATAGQFRAGRGDEQSRPDRLIKHLSRILHETVALKSLLDAAERRPSDREWELEARVAVSALAARVRLLAGAVALPGELPLGDQESAAVRRLVRQTEKVRRAGLAGDEDLVAVALVGQVRRSIERITGSTDAARRVVAGGVRVGLGPPRPFTPHPMAAWSRLERAVRTRSPGLRHSARVGLSVAVAMALTAVLKLKHGHWMTITVMQAQRGTYGETVTHLVQRAGGTVLGSAIAGALLALAPDRLAAALILFVFALLAFALRGVNFTYWALFGTPLAMMLLDFSAPSTWLTAAERVLLTLAGCAIVFLALRLLWPHGYAERLPVQLERLLTEHGALARAAAAVVEGDSERLPQDRVAAAEQAAETINDTRTRLGEERVPAAARIAELRRAVRAAHRIRDHLIAIGRMAREESVDAGPIPEILDRVADRLDDAAAELDDPPGPDGAATAFAARLDEEFARLDDHLSRIARRRRAEVEGGVGADEFTPLRHSLLQVSGTRYAVRALRRDADEMIAAAVAARHSAETP
ncbi:FUSC family protein [Actinomadura parmotrematis]|uniref:FUSC family protein n=1 Tax=Actinomadura parmotrematis TaxID=2864039 RepID=A0ABS7FRA2_9ACTN|nr:FUSC family protein [Actinomadura parmotrematis]MBW8482930.1 FUSC family protein [Actinomadura parmotrematis]